MQLFSYNQDSFSSTLSERCSPIPHPDFIIVFTAELSCLRAFWASIRECREEILEDDFEDRLGFSMSTIMAWKESLREIYDSAEMALNTSGAVNKTRQNMQHEEASPALVLTPEGQDLPLNALLLGADTQELTAYSRMLKVTLQEIEDWEYHLRMGFTQDQVRKLVLGINRILADS